LWFGLGDGDVAVEEESVTILSKMADDVLEESDNEEDDEACEFDNDVAFRCIITSS